MSEEKGKEKLQELQEIAEEDLKKENDGGQKAIKGNMMQRKKRKYYAKEKKGKMMKVRKLKRLF